MSSKISVVDKQKLGDIFSKMGIDAESVAILQKKDAMQILTESLQNPSPVAAPVGPTVSADSKPKFK